MSSVGHHTLKVSTQLGHIKMYSQMWNGHNPFQLVRNVIKHKRGICLEADHYNFRILLCNEMKYGFWILERPHGDS